MSSVVSILPAQISRMPLNCLVSVISQFRSIFNIFATWTEILIASILSGEIRWWLTQLEKLGKMYKNNKLNIFITMKLIYSLSILYQNLHASNFRLAINRKYSILWLFPPWVSPRLDTWCFRLEKCLIFIIYYVKLK